MAILRCNFSLYWPYVYYLLYLTLFPPSSSCLSLIAYMLMLLPMRQTDQCSNCLTDVVKAKSMQQYGPNQLIFFLVAKGLIDVGFVMLIA